MKTPKGNGKVNATRARASHYADRTREHHHWAFSVVPGEKPAYNGINVSLELKVSLERVVEKISLGKDIINSNC